MTLIISWNNPGKGLPSKADAMNKSAHFTLFIFLYSSLTHRTRQEVTTYEPCSLAELAGTFPYSVPTHSSWKASFKGRPGASEEWTDMNPLSSASVRWTEADALRESCLFRGHHQKAEVTVFYRHWKCRMQWPSVCKITRILRKPCTRQSFAYIKELFN